MENPMTVLLLGAGKDNLEYLSALRSRYGANVVATDYSADADGRNLADEFIHASYLSVEDISRRLKGKTVHKVLLGTTSHNAYVPKLLLEKKFRIKIEAPIANVRECIDKSRLDLLLKQTGFPNLNTLPAEKGLFKNTSPKSLVIKSGSEKNKRVVFLAPGKEFRIDDQGMIIQNFIEGKEYRIDVFPRDRVFVLEKLKDDIYCNLSGGEVPRPVEECVLNFHRKMGFQNTIVKYDVIHSDKTYIIDLGFDYPIRFCGMISSLGINPVDVLLSYYLFSINRFGEYIRRVNKTSMCVKGLTVL
jgi:hypothetical protein